MEARDAALAIVQAVREPLVVLDADCRVGLANDAFYALLGETADADRRQAHLGHRHGIWTSVRASVTAVEGRVSRQGSRSSNLEMERCSRAGRARSC